MVVHSTPGSDRNENAVEHRDSYKSNCTDDPGIFSLFENH
jgi:hypothetical protein